MYVLGTFIYVDDVTLLAPTSMALQVLLSIPALNLMPHIMCSLIHGQLNVDIWIMLVCNYKNLEFLDRQMEYVDGTDSLLSISVTSNTRDKNMNIHVGVTFETHHLPIPHLRPWFI